jgi:hypothetical protein
MIEVPSALATCRSACAVRDACPDVHGPRPRAAKSSSHQRDSACSFAFLRVATFLAPLSREKSNADLRKGSRAASRRLQMSLESPSSLTTQLTQGSPRLASFAIVATDSESTQDRFAKNRRLAGSAFSTPRGADLFGSIRPVARSVDRGSLLAHFVAAVKSRRNEPPKASI